MSAANVSDPIGGFAGVPRNMTGIASKLKSAGYDTHMVGKFRTRPDPRPQKNVPRIKHK